MDHVENLFLGHSFLAPSADLKQKLKTQENLRNISFSIHETRVQAGVQVYWRKYNNLQQNYKQKNGKLLIEMYN